MPSRKYKYKKSKKGGFFQNISQRFNGNKTQTFCCEKKESQYKDGTNSGYNCKPSMTSQCYPGYNGESYKFRCFNYDENTDHTNISEQNVGSNGEKCEYISGSLSKLIGKPVGAFSKVVALPLVSLATPQYRGGRTRRRKIKSKRSKKRTLRRSHIKNM